MLAATRAAQDDSRANALQLIDSIDVLRIGSWRYSDVARLLADRLGLASIRGVHHAVGGETSLRVVHDAVRRR